MSLAELFPNTLKQHLYSQAFTAYIGPFLQCSMYSVSKRRLWRRSCTIDKYRYCLFVLIGGGANTPHVALHHAAGQDGAERRNEDGCVCVWGGGGNMG